MDEIYSRKANQMETHSWIRSERVSNRIYLFDSVNTQMVSRSTRLSYNSLYIRLCRTGHLFIHCSLSVCVCPRVCVCTSTCVSLLHTCSMFRCRGRDRPYARTHTRIHRNRTLHGEWRWRRSRWNICVCFLLAVFIHLHPKIIWPADVMREIKMDVVATAAIASPSLASPSPPAIIPCVSFRTQTDTHNCVVSPVWVRYRSRVAARRRRRNSRRRSQKYTQFL